MNESVFRELLSESLQREFAEFDNAPEHKFSLGHRLAMKRIFAKYEKNVRRLKKANGGYMTFQGENMPYYSIKQRVIFALVIIILMTLLTGWVIPIRGITEAQIDWLRSRYDFPAMKMSVGQAFNADENAQYSVSGIYVETEEYAGFLTDLVDLGLYSGDEVDTIRMKPAPLDTRPGTPITQLCLTALTMSLGGESPLDSYRGYVAFLEEQIEYYNKRSEDPSQAVEGDREFAEIIAEHYLPLPKSFLELLEKLYADIPDDEDENRNNKLSDLDKDDRRHLSEINKL